MASPGVPTLPTSHSEGMRVPSLGAMGMLPPMQGSPCSSATATVLQEQSPGMIGRMPSFHSIKIGSVAHNDPAELLARARGDLVALPRPDKDEDPAALLLAKAREASGGGGLRRNNSISGISLLPFQSRQLPAPSGLSAPAKALAARGAPALGETTLPLIEQHTQMRLQQQRRQPQGLHLPMAPSAAHVVSPPAQRVAEEPLGMLAGDVGRLPARASEQHAEPATADDLVLPSRSAADPEQGVAPFDFEQAWPAQLTTEWPGDECSGGLVGAGGDDTSAAGRTPHVHIGSLSDVPERGELAGLPGKRAHRGKHQANRGK